MATITAITNANAIHNIGHAPVFGLTGVLSSGAATSVRQQGRKALGEAAQLAGEGGSFDVALDRYLWGEGGEAGSVDRVASGLGLGDEDAPAQSVAQGPVGLSRYHTSVSLYILCVTLLICHLRTETPSAVNHESALSSSMRCTGTRPGERLATAHSAH
jgi:hypothetical protein